MMKNLEEIENAVANLSLEDAVRFRVWYEDFEANLLKHQIEKDLKVEKIFADFLTDRCADYIETYRDSKVTEVLNRIYGTESSDMEPSLVKLQVKSIKKADDSSW